MKKEEFRIGKENKKSGMGNEMEIYFLKFYSVFRGNGKESME